MTDVLHIEARRWFQSIYGNTYHTVRVWRNGELAGTSGITYGYGEHFFHTVGELLGMDDPYHMRAVAHDDDNISVSVIDVDLKRNLH